ncbi:MAG: hypothetical protein H6708_02220 [Kofleriaceae bacterium]|nr:hypothetical protein [Kofleriaceae bacterium]
MRAVAARAVVIALALAPTALAGCGRAAPVVSRADCEHVLAHLYVLEKDQPERPISRYHPAAGTGKDVFMARCPKVLSAREVDCYLRATSAASADDCLHRRELDRRLGGTGLPDPLAVPTTPAAPSAPPGLAIDAAVAVTPAAPPVDAAAPAPPNLVVDAAVPTAPPADAAVAPPALDAGATAARPPPGPRPGSTPATPTPRPSSATPPARP